MEEEMRNHNCVIRALSRENFAFGNTHKKEDQAKSQEAKNPFSTTEVVCGKHTFAILTHY